MWRPGISRQLSSRGIRHRHVRWKLQLAWTDLDARERLLIRALLSFYLYYGDNFKIECPTGSGKLMNLFEVAQEIANRLTGNIPARRIRPATRLWRQGEIPDRSLLERLLSVL